MVLERQGGEAELRLLARRHVRHDAHHPQRPAGLVPLGRYAVQLDPAAPAQQIDHPLLAAQPLGAAVPVGAEAGEDVLAVVAVDQPQRLAWGQRAQRPAAAQRPEAGALEPEEAGGEVQLPHAEPGRLERQPQPLLAVAQPVGHAVAGVDVDRGADHLLGPALRVALERHRVGQEPAVPADEPARPVLGHEALDLAAPEPLQPLRDDGAVLGVQPPQPALKRPPQRRAVRSPVGLCAEPAEPGAEVDLPHPLSSGDEG